LGPEAPRFLPSNCCCLSYRRKEVSSSWYKKTLFTHVVPDAVLPDEIANITDLPEEIGGGTIPPTAGFISLNLEQAQRIGGNGDIDSSSSCGSREF
jgi:hypothetical protein